MDLKQFNPQKILFHYDRVYQFLKGKTVYPVCVELFPSDLCNHRCVFCVSEYYAEKNKRMLPKKLMFRIIKQISQVSKAVTFTGGGEPLMNPHTVEAAVYAKNLGLDVGFITNGSLLDREKNKALIKSCTWIRISLDAGNARLYARIRRTRREDFKKVIYNLKDLARQKRRLKSKITVGAQFIVHPLNSFNIYNCAKLVKETGVDYFQIRPVDIRPESNDKYRPQFFRDSMKPIRKSLKLASKSFDVIPIAHKFNDALSPEKNYGRNYKQCLGPNFTAVVGADAKVYFCCYLAGYDRFAYGDLRKQSFKEIMNSKKRREVFNKVDFSLCQPLCRNHELNKILWFMTHPEHHPNFL